MRAAVRTSVPVAAALAAVLAPAGAAGAQPTAAEQAVAAAAERTNGTPHRATTTTIVRMRARGIPAGEARALATTVRSVTRVAHENPRRVSVTTSSPGLRVRIVRYDGQTYVAHGRQPFRRAVGRLRFTLGAPYLGPATAAREVVGLREAAPINPDGAAVRVYRGRVDVTALRAEIGRQLSGLGLPAGPRLTSVLRLGPSPVTFYVTDDGGYLVRQTDRASMSVDMGALVRVLEGRAPRREEHGTMVMRMSSVTQIADVNGAVVIPRPRSVGTVSDPGVLG
jgi:hypothetical protein